MPEFRPVISSAEFNHIIQGYAVGTVLEKIFETDASRLPELFPTWPVHFQILYAANVFLGQVCNGGLTQFFYNCDPVLIRGIIPALQHLRLPELLERYQFALGAYARQLEAANEIRENAKEWKDFVAFGNTLKEEFDFDAFDNWFYADMDDKVKDHLRRFITANQVYLVRICDGDPQLMKVWARSIMERVDGSYRGSGGKYADEAEQDAIAEAEKRQRMEEYVKQLEAISPTEAAYMRNMINRSASESPHYLDLMFTQEVRKRWEADREMGKAMALSILKARMPIVRGVLRGTSKVRFVPGARPTFVVEGELERGGSGSLTIVFEGSSSFERVWSIAKWT